MSNVLLLSTPTVNTVQDSHHIVVDIDTKWLTVL